MWTLEQTKVQIPGGTLIEFRQLTVLIMRIFKKKEGNPLASAYLPGRKISKNFKIIFRGWGTVYLANGICSLPVLALIDIIMDLSVH